MGKFIVFQTQQQDFALAIEQVEKILLFEAPTRIPDTQTAFMGILTYEGERLPLIDMPERLFQKSLIAGPNTKIIVTRWKGQRLGLAVDNVTTVMDFASGGEEPQEDQATTRYIKQIFKQDERLILHLDPEELLSGAAEKEIFTILDK